MNKLNHQLNWIFWGACAAIVPIGIFSAVFLHAKRAVPFADQKLLKLTIAYSPALELPHVEAALGGSILSYPAKRGDTIETVLKKNKINDDSTSQVAGVFRSFTSGDLKKGDVIKVCRSSSLDALSIRRETADGNYVMVNGDPAHGYFATTMKDGISQSERVVSGTISSSFARSAQKAGLPYEVVDQLVDLFSSKIEFRKDLKVGDTFAVVFPEQKNAGRNKTGYGPVSAASITVAGKMYFAVRYVGSDGKLRYFDQDAKPFGDSFLRYPLKFSRISSVFSGARFHPILGIMRPHNGVDFAAPAGTPIRTVADGTVLFAGRSGGNGNMVRIKHNDRYETAYLHMERIDRSVRTGGRVTIGQTIGQVGCTGLCTGPHLHFAMYDNGKYVDPLKTTLPQMIQKQNVIPPQILEARLDTLRAQREQVLLASLGEGHIRG
jgi:murein DD-endopeptidase MepM/ murein hydrolase activator NlpD